MIDIVMGRFKFEPKPQTGAAQVGKAHIYWRVGRRPEAPPDEDYAPVPSR